MTYIHVTTSRGLDNLLDDEIQHLLPNAQTRITPGCVSFEGSLQDAYTLCLWSRLANRVLWECDKGSVRSADDLYNLASEIDWPSHFSSSTRFMVQFNGTNQAINHTQFGAQKVKDAIVDVFQDMEGTRPDVERHDPDIVIYARCRRDAVSIGIDLSGSSLHQRHYRQEQGEAPLKEHVAAAMLMRSGWSQNTALPLCDPMCGSGTLAIEAALMAQNRAPGLQRTKWGFDHWHKHSAALWTECVEQANAQIKPVKPLIYASDIDRQLITKAKMNADAAGVFSSIQFSVNDAVKLKAVDKTPGYIVSNPPYGERLSDLSDLLPVFQALGLQLKQHWHDWQMSLLTSNRDLLRVMKLRASKDYAMMNGKLECKLVNYSISGDNLAVLHEEAEHPFANRIKKNLKRLKPWIKKQNTNCYRIYDADLPEYNVAVDRYDDYYVVQEYAPPKTVDEHKAKRRIQDVLLYLPAALGVSSKQLVLKVREQKKGTKQYEKLDQTKQRIKVQENGAQLWVNLWDYLDTGLFLDHRDTRVMVRQMSKDKDVLNLFSYTGSVSVAAGLGGARSVTTVDMSNTYIQWAKDNFELNKIKGPHRFVKADCTTWLDNHKGKYDVIFIDPPSFSNSKRMDTTWDVQRDHLGLLVKAAKCLSANGTIVFSNNRRGFKLDLNGLEQAGLSALDISQSTIPDDFKRHSNIHKCWKLTHAH